MKITNTKRGVAVGLVVLLVLTMFISCGKLEPSSMEAIEAGTYDWEAAREKCIEDLSDMLEVALGGDASEYADARTEWLTRIEPVAQGAVFPATNPPKDCSVGVLYRGYSAPEHNSEQAEYVLYTARVMNKTTLVSVEYTITIKLGRGRNGYVISGFEKEAVTDA